MDLSEPFPTAHAHAPATPVLRTVLLCDIVDSTAMVERLGDQRAASLLQRHDVMLRQLVTLCHGQLIDKADGVLAVFERPIQALDFALRYQRGLLDIGREDGLTLKARIGIHVGDVMMWANEPRDVLAGAKAFELEGLAKPVAARLMGLALPGQILMSGMAQNLSQRAAGELGDAGTKLRWLMHGRYRFKGVPAPMLVHEVGMPGLSPLRAPESGNKAWRELPLWRRPPVVAVELLVLGALLVGGAATMLRAPPAIAFAERDWVVVADLQNRTDEALFDDALDTALLVGLEQSRHVNVISQLQIDRALERMQRQGQPVDRQLATELALREGARAVVLPTVAQVGGVVRVSLEVIDPQSGVTVYSESADAVDRGQVLGALDATTTRVRSRLGEAMSSIEASAEPLQQVTTGNLEALRAYSLALDARYEGDITQSRALTEEAVKLDPDFSMAHLHLAFLHYLDDDVAGTRRHLEVAKRHRERLTQREGLFLDGAEATLDSPQVALDKFSMLASLYPDEFRAHYNFAYFAHFDALEDRRALERLQPALVPQNARQGSARYLAGVIRLALDDTNGALSEFASAEAYGNAGFKREYAEAHAVLRDYRAARSTTGLQARTGVDATDLEMRLLMVALPLDQGRHGEALAAARALQAEAESGDVEDLVRWNQQAVTLMLRTYAPDATLRGDVQALGQAVTQGIAAADVLRRRHLLALALTSGWMAARTGDAGTAAAMLATAPADDALLRSYPLLAGLRRIVEAEGFLAAGEPERAIALLAPATADGRGLYFERALLLRAYRAAGQREAALAQARWLSSHRGRAFVEPGVRGTWQGANLIEANLALDAEASLLREAGNDAGAAAAADAFAKAWPEGVPAGFAGES